MGILKPLLTLLAHKVFVAQALIVDPMAKELVEVKVMLHQKSDVACFELHRLVSKNFRVWPDVDIEGSRGVARARGIPLECSNTNLERVHPTAAML